MRVNLKFWMMKVKWFLNWLYKSKINKKDIFNVYFVTINGLDLVVITNYSKALIPMVKSIRKEYLTLFNISIYQDS